MFRARPGWVRPVYDGEWTDPATLPAEGWYAKVTTRSGEVLELSRLDGEDDWIVDASWAANGMPRFACGFGNRVVLRTFASSDMSARLDDYVAMLPPVAAGLNAETKAV